MAGDGLRGGDQGAEGLSVNGVRLRRGVKGGGHGVPGQESGKPRRGLLFLFFRGRHTTAAVILQKENRMMRRIKKFELRWEKFPNLLRIKIRPFDCKFGMKKKASAKTKLGPLMLAKSAKLANGRPRLDNRNPHLSPSELR